MVLGVAGDPELHDRRGRGADADRRAVAAAYVMRLEHDVLVQLAVEVDDDVRALRRPEQDVAAG